MKLQFSNFSNFSSSSNDPLDRPPFGPITDVRVPSAALARSSSSCLSSSFLSFKAWGTACNDIARRLELMGRAGGKFAIDSSNCSGAQLCWAWTSWGLFSAIMSLVAAGADEVDDDRRNNSFALSLAQRRSGIVQLHQFVP